MRTAPAAALPFRIVRLTLGTLLRALGFLLVRAPSEARDELVALGSVVGRPGRLLAARRQRRVTNLRTAKEVEHLLAPPWLPYRHGLDYVGDVGTAAIDVAREAVGGRSVRSADLVDTDDAAASQERGLVGLLLRNPRFWLVVGSVLLALVAARDLLTGGPLHGGALLPAPAHLSHWWGSYVEANHLLGTGSAAPAPAYLLPLAVGGTLLLGHPGWLVSVLFLLSVPLAALSALRFFRRLVPGRRGPAVGRGGLRAAAGDDRRGRAGPPRHGGRRDRAALGRDQRAGALGDRRRPALALGLADGAGGRGADRVRARCLAARTADRTRCHRGRRQPRPRDTGASCAGGRRRSWWSWPCRSC